MRDVRSRAEAHAHTIERVVETVLPTVHAVRSSALRT